VAYCKTLRDFISPVLSLTSTRITDREAICVVWLVLLLPLSLIKSVNALRFSSLFGKHLRLHLAWEKTVYLWLTGVLTIVYMVIAVGWHSLDSLISGKVHPRWTQREMWINFDLSEIMEAVPIIMFAFTCQVLYLWGLHRIDF
jgi:amino acid permease